jgi:CobQ-like glutamine amidotransferase family enzyme
VPDLVNGKRFSGFVKLTHEDFEVVGYRNSEVVGSELFVKGGFIGTLMFGPILAKNPDLLKLLAREMQLEIRLENSYWDLVSEVRRNLTFG